MKKKFKRGQAVRVCWVDSAANEGWQGRDAGETGKVVSLGFVTKAEAECLTISTSIAHNGHSHSPITIPWKCILKVQELEEKWSRNNSLPV